VCSQPRLQATCPSHCGAPRLAQRAAGPWRPPQRRSTAPALPSAETGWLPRRAFQKRPRLLVARACGITPRSRRGPTASHQARAGGTRTFSPARAWWLPVGPASTRTLGAEEDPTEQVGHREQLLSVNIVGLESRHGTDRHRTLEAWLSARNPVMEGDGQKLSSAATLGQRGRTKDPRRVELGFREEVRYKCSVESV